jgi:hypothetical protein
MLGDVASLARKWNKALAARLPVAGKKACDRTEFDGPFLAIHAAAVAVKFPHEGRGRQSCSMRRSSFLRAASTRGERRSPRAMRLT